MATVAEAVKLLSERLGKKVSRSTVHFWISKGYLTAYTEKGGKKVYLLREELGRVQEKKVLVLERKKA